MFLKFSKKNSYQIYITQIIRKKNQNNLTWNNADENPDIAVCVTDVLIATPCRFNPLLGLKLLTRVNGITFYVCHYIMYMTFILSWYKHMYIHTYFNFGKQQKSQKRKISLFLPERDCNYLCIKSMYVLSYKYCFR